MKMTINDDNLQNLQIFSTLLKKDENTLLNEALKLFFEQEQKKLLEKSIADEQALTNLSFDEFWDDVEI